MKTSTVRSCLCSLVGISHHGFPWLVEQQTSSVGQRAWNPAMCSGNVQDTEKGRRAQSQQTTENETAWLCVEAGAGPSPAQPHTHRRRSYVVETAARWRMCCAWIDCFPKEQSKHISAKHLGPLPLERKVHWHEAHAQCHTAALQDICISFRKYEVIFAWGHQLQIFWVSQSKAPAGILSWLQRGKKRG